MGRDDLNQSDAFANLLGYIPAGAWWASPDGTQLLYVNPAIEALTGHSREEFRSDGTLWLQVVVPEDQPAALAAAYKAVNEGRSEVEFRIARPDGQIRWVCDRKTLVRDAAGRPLGIGGFMVDITDAKAAQEKLFQSEKKHRALVETTDTGYLILDGQGRVVDANAEYVRLAGHASLDEIVGHSVVEWTADHDRERNTAEVARCLRQGSVRDLAMDYVDRQGRITPVEIQATVVATGDSFQIIALCRDISARRQAEQALRDSEELYRLHFENVGDIVSSIDLDMRITAISPSVERVSGYRPDELIGRRLDEVGYIPADELPRAMEEIGHVLAGETRTARFVFLTKAGAAMPVEITASPLIRQGRVEGLVTVARDIRERVRGEEALRTSEAQNRAIVHALPDVVYRISRSGVYGAIVSDHGFKFQRPWSEFQGRSVREKTPAEFAEKVERAIERAFVTGEVQTLEYETEDPATGENRFREARYVAAGPDEALCLTRDITDRKQTEEALRTSEARNRALVEAMPDNLVILDPQGVFLEVISDRGYVPVRSRAEVLGHSIREFEPAAAADSVIASIEEAIRTQKTVTAEIEVPPPHGEQAGRWRDARYVALGPDRVLRLTRDITAHKLAEDKLRRNEALLAGAVDLAGLAIMQRLWNGAYLWVSDLWLALHGVARRQFTPAEYLSAFVHPDDQAAVTAARTAFLEEKNQQYDIEYRIVRQDTREVRTVRALWKMVCGADGVPERTIMVIQDITARKQAEEALRNSEARNRSLIEAVPDNMVLFNRQGVFKEIISDRGHQLTRSRDELVGKDVREILSPEMADRMVAGIEEALQTSRTVTTEVAVPPPHGTQTVQWREARFVATGPDEVLGLTRDITARKQAEEALRKSEEQHRRILHAAMDGFYIADGQGHLLEANEAYCRMSGYSQQELLSLRISDLEAVETPDETAAHIRRLQEQGEARFETRHRRKDGTVFDVEASIHYQPVGGGQVVAFMRDITARKQAEEEVRRSQALLSTAVRLARLGAVEREWDSERLTVSDEWLAIHGCARRDITVADYVGFTHPDDRPALVAARNAFLNDGKPYDVEYRIIRQDTGEVRVVRGFAKALTRQDGSPERTVTAVQDVTEARRAEGLLRDAVKRVEDLARFPAEDPSPVLRVRRDGLLVYANAAGLAQAEWGCKIDHFLPAVMRPTFDLALESGRPRECELPSGDRVFGMMFVPIPGEEDVNVYGHDITELKRHEEEISRLNRTLRALGEANKAMMRAETETDFLEAVCRLIVEDCGHAMVWIGYAQQDEGRSVSVEAHAGFEEGYLERLGVTWADTPRGRGPTGTCIRIGLPSIVRDMRSDLGFAPWRQDALMRGYAAAIALPLMGEKSVLGAVSIYSRATDPFSPEEVALLSQLATDVSYGIAAIRMRQARARAEEENRWYHERLRKVATELTLAEEGERRRLASQLHDNLLQILGLIQIKLSMLESPASSADPGGRARELASLVARAVEASRSLTHQLGHPALYDLGFVAGAQRLAEDIETLYSKKVVVDDDEQPKPLSVPIRVMLFQGLRESLVNACKHAGVDLIQVRIRRIGDHVRVVVADRGVGFDPDSIQRRQARGFGLFSLRERLGYLGGRVHVRSSPGKGAVVAMTVPVDGAADAGDVPGIGPSADSGRIEPDDSLEGNP